MSAAPRRQSNLQRRQPAVQRRRPAPSSHRRRRRLSLSQARRRGVAVEMSILLGVNLVIVAAASAAIVKLVPHHLAERAKFKVLQSEVNMLEHRVNALRQDFSGYFDPQRSLTNQRDLGIQALPGQRPVHFVEPERGESVRPGSGR